MARIKNIDLPKNKRIVVALTYIYGIGPARAHEICSAAKISEDKSPISNNDIEIYLHHFELNNKKIK